MCTFLATPQLFFQTGNCLLCTGRGSPTSGVAHEQGVLAVEDHALHLPFANIIIDGHGAIGGEHSQCFPLAERVVHGIGHEMLR